MSTSSATKPLSISPLLWIMLFDHTSLNITFPVLTLIFFDVQSNLFAPDATHALRSMWYGFAVAAPNLVNIFVTPFMSALSDEFGRKKILCVGVLGAFIFAVLAGLGVLWGMLGLLFLGLLIRGAFSRTNPIAQAVVGDISAAGLKVHNMGYLQFAISMGAFVGPLLGGYFASQFFFVKFNYSLPFFIAAVFALLGLLLTLIIFRETLTPSARMKSSWFALHPRTFKKVIMNPQVLKISAVLLLSQIGWSLYYQFMPPILKTSLNFDAHALGWFVGMIAFWLALATGLGIRFLEKFFNLKKMLTFSLVMILSGLLLTILFCLLRLHGLWQISIWIAAIPTAIGDVVAYSCLITLYSNVVQKEEQGKVMGICFVVVAVIWSLTGLLGGVMMSVYELLPLLVAPLGVLGAIMLLRSLSLKFI
jgi:DHA1 family tetracycline resistance protein-like MFS transporter